MLAVWEEGDATVLTDWAVEDHMANKTKHDEDNAKHTDSNTMRLNTVNDDPPH